MDDRLQRLLDECGQRLHALLLRMTLRNDAAEDLLQELFLKLARSSGFAQAKDPCAYAFRAAIHLALDDRRNRLPSSVLEQALVAAGTNPLEAVMRNEQAARMLAAISELSPSARDATVLHFIEQHSFEEAALIMGKTAHQVRGLCADALRQLRAKFKVSDSTEVPYA